MNFAEFQTADRRLVLLRALAAAAQYKANAFLLRSYAQSVGHTASADQIATDLAWLAEQQLIACERVSDVTIATINQRGLDVANGSAQVPGVARPQPGF
jgi:hypothetical protein